MNENQKKQYIKRLSLNIVCLVIGIISLLGLIVIFVFLGIDYLYARTKYLWYMIEIIIGLILLGAVMIYKFIDFYKNRETIKDRIIRKYK